MFTLKTPKLSNKVPESPDPALISLHLLSLYFEFDLLLYGGIRLTQISHSIKEYVLFGNIPKFQLIALN